MRFRNFNSSRINPEFKINEVYVDGLIRNLVDKMLFKNVEYQKEQFPKKI